jgi:hypothetical protein
LAKRRNFKKKASTSNTPVVTDTSKGDTEAVQVKSEELQSSVILGTASTETLSDSSKIKRAPLNFTQSLSINKKRRHDESYLSFGSTSIGNKDSPDTQCVLCNKILSNCSLVPAKLGRHIETNHSEFKDQGVRFLRESFNHLKQVNSPC